jgi:hypothetical protein
MREHEYQDETYDAFGWLKTLVLILVVFAVMIGSGIATARAGTCTESCRTKHNDCRIQTKGSRDCDVKHNACIQVCVASLQQHLLPALPKKN